MSAKSTKQPSNGLSNRRKIGVTDDGSLWLPDLTQTAGTKKKRKSNECTNRRPVLNVPALSTGTGRQMSAPIGSLS